MTILHNNIKNYATKKKDYFEKEIDKVIIPIATSDIIFFGTLLTIYTCMNRKRYIITNKIG